MVTKKAPVGSVKKSGPVMSMNRQLKNGATKPSIKSVTEKPTTQMQVDEKECVINAEEAELLGVGELKEENSMENGMECLENRTENSIDVTADNSLDTAVENSIETESSVDNNIIETNENDSDALLMDEVSPIPEVPTEVENWKSKNVSKVPTQPLKTTTNTRTRATTITSSNRSRTK